MRIVYRIKKAVPSISFFNSNYNHGRCLAMPEFLIQTASLIVNCMQTAVHITWPAINIRRFRKLIIM